MEVHAKGGGIHYTVDCVRRASLDQLYTSLDRRLTAMLTTGTTVVEAKSGYGLDLENETKMLRAIERAKREHAMTISSTYCGAHAITKLVHFMRFGIDPDYIELISMEYHVRCQKEKVLDRKKIWSGVISISFIFKHNF